MLLFFKSETGRIARVTESNIMIVGNGMLINWEKSLTTSKTYSDQLTEIRKWGTCNDWDFMNAYNSFLSRSNHFLNNARAVSEPFST